MWVKLTITTNAPPTEDWAASKKVHDNNKFQRKKKSKEMQQHSYQSFMPITSAHVIKTYLSALNSTTKLPHRIYIPFSSQILEQPSKSVLTHI